MSRQISDATVSAPGVAMHAMRPSLPIFALDRVYSDVRRGLQDGEEEVCRRRNLKLSRKHDLSRRLGRDSAWQKAIGVFGDVGVPVSRRRMLFRQLNAEYAEEQRRSDR
jgi:hypothetical protein